MELMPNNDLPRWRLNKIADNCNDSKNEWKKVVIVYDHRKIDD